MAACPQCAREVSLLQSHRGGLCGACASDPEPPDPVVETNQPFSFRRAVKHAFVTWMFVMVVGVIAGAFHQPARDVPIDTVLEQSIARGNAVGRLGMWVAGLAFVVSCVSQGGGRRVAGRTSLGLQAPTRSVEDAQGERLERVAKDYRALILLVGCEYIVRSMTRRPYGAQPDDALVALGLLAQLVAVLLAVFSAIRIYRLAVDLQLSAPVPWAIGGLIPIVNLIVLLRISAEARAFFGYAGIRVGLLGPSSTDIEHFLIARPHDAHSHAMDKLAQARPKSCPKCKLFNRPTATFCDCGHTF